jgi:ABC-2 type transport system permease protein
VIDAIRSEWIKVSTVSVTWVLTIIAVAFPLLVTGLTTGFADEFWTGEDLASLITGLTIVSAMLLGVVSTISVTNEFANNTIRPTFAAMPDRIRPLGAKAIVQVVLSFVVATVTVIVGWVLGAVISGDSPDLGDGTAVPTMVGVVLLAVGISVLGYGLGLLIRNSAAAVCLLLLWPLIAEGLIAGLLAAIGFHDAVRFLPYASGINMALTEPDPESFGRVGGGLYFFAWVVVIAVLGVLSARKRDA